MQEESNLDQLSLIDLSLTDRLQSQEFRREWFRAELEEDVPASFRALRERRGKTQSDLAADIGTKQPAISRFEKSTEAVWEFEFILRMAEALDARLRLVVEAAEDIIEEYDDRPEGKPVGASGLAGMAFTTSQRSPFDINQIAPRGAIDAGRSNESGINRGIENRGLGGLSFYAGNSVPPRPLHRAA